MIDMETARARSFALVIDLGTKLQVLADRELAGTGFTARQWVLCLAVERAGVPLALSEAARRLGTSRQNAKQLALKLEAKGYLSIERDPSDARSLLLSTTAACRAFWERRTDEDRRLLSSAFSGLADKEIAAFYESLLRLGSRVHALLADDSQVFKEEPL